MYFQAKGIGEISVYEVSKLKKVDRIRNDRSPRKVGKNNEKNSKKINIQTFSPIPLNKFSGVGKACRKNDVFFRILIHCNPHLHSRAAFLVDG